MLCRCISEQALGHIHDRGRTALMTKGAMLSTRATPLRILFLFESAYIRKVVNTGTYCQWVRFGQQYTYSLAGPITLRICRT